MAAVVHQQDVLGFAAGCFENATNLAGPFRILDELAVFNSEGAQIRFRQQVLHIREVGRNRVEG
ncbi:hypothetical protein QMA15_32240 [Rhodococcus sp. APC 3903]|nr:hypothetical protein [Rhodococcus sp. APC 3903]MDN3461088.1 hypothetical protein [Rhodococcus sp. APC 3903]